MNVHLDQSWRAVVKAIKQHSLLYARHEQEMVELVITRALEDDKIQSAISCHLHELALQEGEL